VKGTDVTLDAATQAFVDGIRAQGGPPIHEMSVADVRGLGAALAPLAGPEVAMAAVRDDEVAVEGGVIQVRTLLPTARPRGLVVWYHGGGWVFGSVDEADRVARRLAARTGCAVTVVGYRLAPEHRFPVAVHDAEAALRWAADHVERLVGGRVPLLVGGDSCGGNLAAVVARRARDRGGPALAGQLLLHPVTDCDLDRPSYLDPAAQVVLTREAVAWFWDHYLPGRDARRHPDASPLRTPDLAGLPPAVVVTAEHEPVRDEGAAYAEALRRAGVRVDERCFAGQMHNFLLFGSVLPAAEEAFDHVAAAVDRMV
jgi:acetyl esterase